MSAPVQNWKMRGMRIKNVLIDFRTSKIMHIKRTGQFSWMTTRTYCFKNTMHTSNRNPYLNSAVIFLDNTRFGCGDVFRRIRYIQTDKWTPIIGWTWYFAKSVFMNKANLIVQDNKWAKALLERLFPHSKGADNPCRRNMDYYSDQLPHLPIEAFAHVRRALSMENRWAVM